MARVSGPGIGLKWADIVVRKAGHDAPVDEAASTSAATSASASRIDLALRRRGVPTATIRSRLAKIDAGQAKIRSGQAKIGLEAATIARRRARSRAGIRSIRASR